MGWRQDPRPGRLRATEHRAQGPRKREGTRDVDHHAGDEQVLDERPTTRFQVEARCRWGGPCQGSRLPASDGDAALRVGHQRGQDYLRAGKLDRGKALYVRDRVLELVGEEPTSL